MKTNTKKKTNTNNTIKFSDIKTPKTVEEFRENLIKYYVCMYNFKKSDIETQTIVYDKLMVMGENEIPIKDISSFSDIYKITKTGFYSKTGKNPSITPKVYIPDGAVQNFMMKSGQYLSFNGFFDDETNDYSIWDNQKSFVDECPNVCWYTLDNQIVRDFYAKTLGEFSGFTPLSSWT